mmetsp:Transcript_5206/g.13371  ORF Transcript_5206/g.13371 Transcript_5206/m.13371 type:complete len:238 (-) Transcript_5206:196-909(-)
MKEGRFPLAGWRWLVFCLSSLFQSVCSSFLFYKCSQDPPSALYLPEEVGDGGVDVPVGGVERVAGLLLAKAHLHEGLHVPLLEHLRVAGVRLRPVLGRGLEKGEVVEVLLGHHRVLRVGRLGRAQQRLKREERRLDRERGRPLVLENVQANRPVLGAHVRVPDLALEAHLRRLEGVHALDLNVDHELAPGVGRVHGAAYLPLQGGQVVAEHPHADPGGLVVPNLLDLLLKPAQVHPD